MWLFLTLIVTIQTSSSKIGWSTFGTENIPRSTGEQYIYNQIIYKLMVEETDRWNKSNK